MKSKTSRYGRFIATGIFFLAVFLFWFLGYPQWLNYHEQNQLFLFTADYFLADVSVPSGLADYIGEFITQFFYLRWAGALLLVVLFALLQWLTWKLLSWHDDSAYVISFIPSLLLIWHLGDINVLMSYFIALIFVVLTTSLMKNKSPLSDLIVIPLLYWAAGPLAWVYVLVRCLTCGYKHLWTMLYLPGIQGAAYLLFLSQWPFQMVMTGLNYYRIPLQLPLLQVIIPISVTGIVAWSLLTKKRSLNNKPVLVVQLLTVILLAVGAATKGFDADIYELLWQDEMVRKAQWNKIIERAEKHQLKTAFSSQCVNLSLAMTGQLPYRMFTFHQSGPDALLMPMVRDNTSNLPTAEAFYQLGMVNSALRYMFDMQQSILNFKKSGRFTKRIAECYIINGNYEAADKHIELLRHTFFYRAWAKRASACLYDDKRVEAHRVWGRLRQWRYTEQFLYNYEEKDKMLGLLFLNNKENKMALAYFMGQMLLDGNIQGFMDYMPWVKQYGGHIGMPAGYADAVECIKAQGNLPGSPYAGYVRSMMKTHERK